MKRFRRKDYIPIRVVKPTERIHDNVPDGLWGKCPYCGQIYHQSAIDAYRICPNCQAHFRMSVSERLAITVDEQSFQEWLPTSEVTNPLDFPQYEDKLTALKQRTKLDEAVVVGCATIDGQATAIGVMDTHFIMGSMGRVVGEKITYLFDEATKNKLPVVLFCASGGARMQEGIISLMQMAKTSAAVANHSQAGGYYIAVLTDPTTGGVTASFAMEADTIIAEPKATIGFAGRWVIEQTIKEQLSDDFQSAEQVQRNGFVDVISPRRELTPLLGKLLRWHTRNEVHDENSK